MIAYTLNTRFINKTQQSPLQTIFFSLFTGKMSQYKRHKEIHSDYRPYPCTEESCDKAFRTKAHLTEHMLIHSGIKVNINLNLYLPTLEKMITTL